MKAKFNKLDRSKLSKEVNSILDKIKKATDNFKKEDKKAEALFDRLYDKIKEGKPEAIKSTKKPSKTKKKKSSGGNRGVFVKLAKSIRDAKPSMTWNEALKEASKKLKADKEKANKKFASSIQTIIDANKKYFGSKTASSLEKDAKQPAKPIGKRRSKKGKTYYEYRTNRTDVKQPPKSFPMLEKGGNVDLFDNYETLPKKVRDTIDFYMEKYQDGDYTYEDSKNFLEEMQKQGYTFEYGLDNEPYDLRKMAKGGKVEFITTRFTNKGFGYSSDDYIAKVPYKNKVYIVQMGGLWNDYNLSFEEMQINDEDGNLVDKRIARAVFRKMLKEKPSTPPKPIKEIKFAKGGAIKGRNNKTGESYGVVIGSMKYTDEDKDRVQVDVRSSYSSRISERQLVFDTKGNLIETTNYGYTLDGTLPKRGSGQGKSINASNKKETIDALVDLGYNKGFANKLIDAVKDEEFAKGGKIGFEGLAKKVAKNYEGKKVKPKFQDEYGKTYDKEEAMQVGRAVAGKVLKQQNMKKMEDGGIVREENVAYQGGLNYGTTRTIAPQFGHGGNVNRGSFNVTITMKDGRSADILPIDVSEEDAQDIADMINNMKPMSARADMPLPFEDGGAVTDDYYARGGNVEVGDTILKVNEDDISKVFEMGYEGGIQEYLDDLNNKGLGYAEYDERQQEIYTNSKDILNELENEGIGFKTYGFAKGGKIKIGDVVANTETRTIGVVRDVFEDDGDVRTDADGVVDARNLEHYSKMKHKDYQIAPSTKREIGSKYAKGGKTQGYNARLDESLGNRKGRESTKQQSKKDRRDESKGMEKGSGRRAYSSVSTMDVGDRMMAKGGKVNVIDERSVGKMKIIVMNDGKSSRTITFKDGVQNQFNRNKQEDIDKLWELSSKVPFGTIVDKNYKFAKGGGIFAKGKEGRYRILGVPKSKPMAKPNFHSSVHKFSDIKEAVEVARKDFKDLTNKDYEIFVTDDKEDRQIYNYEKGGKVYIYNDNEYDEDEIVDVLKDDLLVFPDGINNDQDLINYFLENEYMEVKRYAKGGKVSMSEKLKMVEDEAIKIDPNPRNDKEAERVYKIAYKRVMGEDFEKKEIHKYKFKKGDSFETDTSYNLGGKNDIVTITKLEQDLDMLPSYYIGRYKQKRFSKFDGNLSKEELENLVESGKWKKISFEKGGGIFAKGKEGRYHILGVPKSKPMAKPNFHSSVHNFSDIKEAVEVARKDFKDLTDKDYEIFVTDNKEDRQIYNYEKGGKVKAKKEIVEGLEELEVGLAGASKKHKQQSKLAKQIKDGFESSFEKGGNVPKRFLDEKGERKNDPETIEELTEYVMSLPQTKSKHFNKVTNKYSARRQKLHRKIINEFKDELVCIESDEPIAILMGGSPASGKSTFLRKYAPYLLKEELLRIDADEVRAMLPEYKGWNASATHNETQDIVKTLLSDRTIGIPCKYDVIFDGTMTSPKKYLDLIRLLKKLGYKVFVVFIDKVPKDVIMKRAMDRYKKSGRFVPPFVIEEFFETGKDSLAKVKAKVDGYMIVDGSNNNYKVIEQKGLKLPKTRKYSRLGVPLKRKVVKKK